MTNQKYSAWKDSLRSRAGALGLQKAAGADTEAINMKAENEKGEVSTPSCLTSEDRKNLGMPADGANPEKREDGVTRLSTITNPEGTGQGHYITPRDGDARDKAFTSPTTPLSKIAQAARDMTQGRTDSFQMPQHIADDTDTMQKLAALGAFMASTEEGQAAALDALSKNYGMQVAQDFVKSAQAIYAGMQATHEEMQKAAAAAQQQAQQQAFMEKSAAQVAHETRYNSYQTEIEKYAYATGAEDAAAMADSAAAGGPAEIPGEEQLSDEDVMGVFQELIQSGELTEEEAQQILAALTADGQAGGDPQQIAAELQQAVASGQITQEEAEAAAQAILEQMGMGGAEGAAPEGAAPEAAAAPAPEEAAAAGAMPPGAEKAASAQYLVNDAQDVTNYLFG